VTGETCTRWNTLCPTCSGQDAEREGALFLKSSGMAVDYLQTTGLFKPCEIYTAQEFMNIFKAGADQLNGDGYLIEEIRSAGFII
jgi:hypothetical protein